MSIEVMLLGIACGITLLSYLIAINAIGPFRLILSYFVATLLLAATVWAVIQYVKYGSFTMAAVPGQNQSVAVGQDVVDTPPKVQPVAVPEKRDRMVLVSRLNGVVVSGTEYCNSVINANLQDKAVELEVLMARANEIKTKSEQLRSKMDNLVIDDTSFVGTAALIRESMQYLAEAAYYYRLYYYSENSDQELQRERIMRQKARNASAGFQKAGMLLGKIDS